MRNHINIFPLFLSIIVFVYSMYHFSFTSYAEIYRDENGHPHVQNWDDIKEFATNLIVWGSSQLGAVAEYDFAKFVQNQEAWNNLWTEDNVSISDSESGSSITFSEDLTTYLKQALIEYAQETNGFRIYPTISYNSISPSTFKTSYMYRTFRNLVSESGCIIVNTNSSFFNQGDVLYAANPFRQITEDSVSLVAGTNYGGGLIVEGRFYGTNTWLLYSVQAKSFPTAVYDSESETTVYKEYQNFNSGTDITGNIYARPNFGLLDARGQYPLGSIKGWTFFSTDGRKLKVFNSLNALKNYTTGNRSVYFGSGFYDTPGEITVSFDDLEKYIDGKYDDFFKDLKDLIGQKTDNEDSLTEEDLEKLVDKILDKMDESGSGDGNKNDNDNSSLLGSISDMLSGMTSAISGYLDAILMYLESILTDLDYIVLEMQDMTEEEVSTKSDSVISELSGAFSEVGDVMSKKFPFSIPWDIKNIYVTLSGGKEPGIQSLADDIGISSLYHDNSPPSASGGKLIDVVFYPSPEDDGIMLLTADENTGGTASNTPSGGVYFSDSNAPVFTLPLVVESAGVNASILIDMSPFDIVSEFSRTMFLLIFLYQLFLLSMRVFEFVRSFMG